MASPSHANVFISIGDGDSNGINIDYKDFYSLDMTRVVSDAANNFKLMVLDNSAFNIERLLLQGYNNINFEYLSDDGSINERFSGNITKMNSSFINNRNMLTLEGFMGISIDNKYTLKSRPWNMALLFPWEQIFDKYDTNKIISLIAENKIMYSDDGTSKKYFVYSQKEKDKGEQKKIEGTEIYFPVRPSDMVYLLCVGGNLADYMYTDVGRYRNCESFYKLITIDRSTYYKKDETMDLNFIKEFVRKNGDIKGNNWTPGQIDRTLLVENGLSQTRMSDVQYIYSILCANAAKEVSTQGNTSTIEYNFNFTIDNNRKVDFKPINIETNKNNAKTYTYYGDFGSEDADSKLIAFSADTNVLTAFLTGDTSQLEDMKTLNLITGEAMTLDGIEFDIQSNEGLYEYKYGTQVYSINKNTNGKANSWAVLKSAWSKAAAMNYKASATIIGNHGLKAGDYVNILVMPTKISVDGIERPFYHHSSGLYFISEIQENIASGKKTSTLSLIKNVASIGNAIEVLNEDTSTSRTHQGSSERYHGGSGGNY